MINPRIFREYDIRGIVGKDIDRKLAVSLGKAFGAFVKKRRPGAAHVSVGRDVRLSSDELSSGVIEGIRSSGINVYDLGVCPTPAQYFSLYHLDLDGGIMVTGSHNPPEYNGFKISLGKETIYGDDIKVLGEVIRKQKELIPASCGRVEKYDVLRSYRDHLLKEFAYLKDDRFRKVKLVVDAGNGTAGLIAPELFEEINCEVKPLYCEPDGRFPNHHPDPTVVEYIGDLIGETKKWKADAGVGFDGDADRIGVVDARGNIVWGDRLMIVLSREVLKHIPGAKVIGDVKCSQVLFDDIRANGGRPIMWKTGHSLIKQKMRDEGAVLAGEFSGHIFMGDRYFGYDDAIYAGMRLVEIMKLLGKGIEELLADVPATFATPEIRIECDEDEKREIVEKIVVRFREYRRNGGRCAVRDLNMTDGVRVLFDKGWALVRYSNTQPVIVMRVEAVDEDSLRQYKDFVESEVNMVKGK